MWLLWRGYERVTYLCEMFPFYYFPQHCTHCGIKANRKALLLWTPTIFHDWDQHSWRKRPIRPLHWRWKSNMAARHVHEQKLSIHNDFLIKLDRDVGCKKVLSLLNVKYIDNEEGAWVTTLLLPVWQIVYYRRTCCLPRLLFDLHPSFTSVDDVGRSEADGCSQQTHKSFCKHLALSQQRASAGPLAILYLTRQCSVNLTMIRLDASIQACSRWYAIWDLQMCS